MLESIVGAIRWMFLLRPAEFARAVRRLRVDPEDTEQGTVIFYAAGGEDDTFAMARMKASEEGRRILAERRPIPVGAMERPRLRAMPPESLGHALARFFDEEEISSEGLEVATRGVEPPARDGEHAFFRDRGRDVHDILHVVTGYGRDMMGEIALHGFTYGQYRNRAYGLLGGLSCLGAFAKGRRDALRLFLSAYRRGREAPFLPAVDWNTALEEPLDALRGRLHLGLPPAYTPMATDEMPF